MEFKKKEWTRKRKIEKKGKTWSGFFVVYEEIERRQRLQKSGRWSHSERKEATFMLFFLLWIGTSYHLPPDLILNVCCIRGNKFSCELRVCFQYFPILVVGRPIAPSTAICDASSCKLIFAFPIKSPPFHYFFSTPSFSAVSFLTMAVPPKACSATLSLLSKRAQ